MTVCHRGHGGALTHACPTVAKPNMPKPKRRRAGAGTWVGDYDWPDALLSAAESTETPKCWILG